MRPDEIIQKHHFLGALELADARALLKLAQVRPFRTRETIFRRGDPGVGLYGVLSGGVVVTVESESGKELILNTFGPGDFFGEIALLDGKGRTATAVAREPTELLFLARRVFLPFIEQRPQVATHMIALLCERLRRTTQLVEDSTFLNVAARLAKQLLALVPHLEKKEGTADIVQVSQAELAHMIGVSREAVSKQLSLWREARVVRVARGRIIIDRRDYLETFVSLALDG
jgi:CRP/FNR family transcriptional regulator, cyclic AMP receptor protein